MDKFLSKEALNKYKATLQNKHMAPESIQKKLSSLTRFAQWSHKKGYIKNNVVQEENPSDKSTPHYQPISIKKYSRNRKTMLFYIVSISIIFLLLSGFSLYIQRKTKKTAQENPAVAQKIEGKRSILFQGNLTDNLGNPIETKTNVQFALYNRAEEGKKLYSSGTCSIIPEKEAPLAIEIGNNCGSPINQNLFLENQEVYLGITVATDEEMNPRQQISNIAYAEDSHTLQGHALASVKNEDVSQSDGAGANTIPLINQYGNLVLAVHNPRLWSTSGTFQLRGQALTLATDTGSAGDIIFNPDTGGNTFFSAGNVGIRTENPLSFDLQIGGHVGPDKNNAYNLGSTAFHWNTIYANNLIGSDTGILGFIQRNNNAVSLTHVTDNLLIGDTADSSANIKLDGTSGNIGVGTQNPQEKLTLGSTGNFATEMSTPKNILVQTGSGGGLSAGTYYFKVVASDGTSTTQGSSEVSCTVNGTSLTRCALSWDAVIGASLYRVYKGTVSEKQDRYQTASTHSLNYSGDGGATLGSVPTVTTAYVSKWSAVGSSWMLGGNMGIGTTNPSKGKLEIDASRGVLLYTNNTGSGNSIEDSSGAKLTSSGVWTDASDQTKKKNISTLSYGLSDLLKLNPVHYLWKDSGLSDIGFIAQEVQKIIPELVYGVEGNLSMSYGHLTGLIVKSIQEQQNQINKLITDIQNLSQKISVQDLFVNHTFVSPVVITQDITATGSSTFNEIKSNTIQTTTLTVDQIIPQKNELTLGGLSKLIIKNFDNALIAVFDENGNATLSGSLTSETLNTQTASISGVLTADAVTTNTLTASSSSFLNSDIKNLTSDRLYAQDATISATLRAQNIESDNITAIENTLSNIQSSYVSNDLLSTNINDIQKLLAEIRTQPLPTTLYNQDISTNSTNFSQFQPIVTNLTVSDMTHLYDASIANSLTIGSLSFKDDSLLSLAWELKLSALSTINLLDGAVIIAKDGSLTTRGTLIAQGGVQTNEIRPIGSDHDLSIKLHTQSETQNSQQTKNSKLKIQNNFDEEVAYINSSGSAYFKDGISLGKYTDATSSAVILGASDNFNQNGIYAPAIQTSAQTAGVGLLPAYANEVIVYTDKLIDDSLIYITPTTQTKNKTLFVAQKESCMGKDTLLAVATPVCKPYFKVALDKALNVDIKFNWWVVN